jgi:hypothetical protein
LDKKEDRNRSSAYLTQKEVDLLFRRRQDRKGRILRQDSTFYTKTKELLGLGEERYCVTFIKEHPAAFMRKGKEK